MSRIRGPYVRFCERDEAVTPHPTRCGPGSGRRPSLIKPLGKREPVSREPGAKKVRVKGRIGMKKGSRGSLFGLAQAGSVQTRASFHDVFGNLELLEVLHELLDQLLGLGIVLSRICPGVTGIQQLSVDSGN